MDLTLTRALEMVTNGKHSWAMRAWGVNVIAEMDVLAHLVLSASARKLL